MSGHLRTGTQGPRTPVSPQTPRGHGEGHTDTRAGAGTQTRDTGAADTEARTGTQDREAATPEAAGLGHRTPGLPQVLHGHSSQREGN